MIIEISQHGLNFGEDLEYVSTFVKGKDDTFNIENYRILTKGVKTGKERLLMLDSIENFFGHKKVYEMSYLEGFKYITPDHLKFKTKAKNYNYYNLGCDISSVDAFFSTWRKYDPPIYIEYVHQFISLVNNYTWTYKFNNKSY
jgi:hypothetical protein